MYDVDSFHTIHLLLVAVASEDRVCKSLPSGIFLTRIQLRPTVSQRGAMAHLTRTVLRPFVKINSKKIAT